MTTTAEPIDHDESAGDVDYPWIRAWGRYINLPEHVTERIIRRARAENAPPYAVYSYVTGDHWVTLGSVDDVAVRLWDGNGRMLRELHIPPTVLEHWLDPRWDPDGKRDRGFY